jgi:hypothetical protein
MYQMSKEMEKSRVSRSEDESKPGAVRVAGLDSLHADDESVEYDGDTGEAFLRPASLMPHPTSQEEAELYNVNTEEEGKEEEVEEERFQDEPQEHDEEQAHESPTAGPSTTEDESQQQPPTKKKKPRINPKFKDVKETGKWGAISRREIYITIAVLVIIVIAVAVTVSVLVTKDDGTDPNIYNTTSPAPTLSMAPTASPAPSPAPTQIPRGSIEEQLVAVLSAIESHELVRPTLDLLSEDVNFYQGRTSDPTEPPQVRAMSWLLYEDPRDNEDFLVARYALVAFYFATSGDSWRQSTNWLTSAHTCDWYGMTCDRFRSTLEGVDLASNNVVGEIPVEINLLDDLRSLILRSNEMTGTYTVDMLVIAEIDLAVTHFETYIDMFSL